MSGSANLGDSEGKGEGGDEKCSPGQVATDLAWRLSHWRHKMREEIGTEAEEILWGDITQVLAKTVLLGQVRTLVARDFVDACIPNRCVVDPSLRSPRSCWAGQTRI